MRQGPNFALLDRVDVVDKHTVRIITKKPWRILENRLALEGSIVPPKYFKEKDEAFLAKTRSAPALQIRQVGEGRGHHAGGERVVVGRGAEGRDLVFRPIPEHATRVAALQAGEVDVVTNVPPHSSSRSSPTRSSTSPRRRASA